MKVVYVLGYYDGVTDFLAIDGDGEVVYGETTGSVGADEARTYNCYVVKNLKPVRDSKTAEDVWPEPDFTITETELQKDGALW